MRWRKPARLRGFDYTLPGPYFFTIRCDFHKEVFNNDRCREIVMDVWQGLPDHFEGLVLDAFVVMPNHLHGIVALGNDEQTPTSRNGGLSSATSGRDESPRRPYSLPEVVNSLKSFSSRKINELRQSPGRPLWQHNYWERVVRNDRALQAIRMYIAMNPLDWHNDIDGKDIPNGIDESDFWERLATTNRLSLPEI